MQEVYYIKSLVNDNFRFLFYLLNYLPLDILNAATGVPGLSRRDAYALKGVFPPIEEQQALAQILDAADTAVERTKEAIEQAYILDHSLLHQLLEKGINTKDSGEGRQPYHWKTHRVSEVADVGAGVTLGKDLSGFKTIELPYLRVANVQDGYLDLSTIKAIRVRVDEVDDYRLEPGDVLMTEGGDIDKLGRGTIWEGQIPDCLHQNHIFRVRVNREILDPYYFSFVVESDIAKRYFFRVAKRTTNLASTNKTQLRAFKFPVPPLEEQREIVKVVRASKAKISALVEKQEALQQLKKALMHDLLTGKKRVNVAELASVV